MAKEGGTRLDRLLKLLESAFSLRQQQQRSQNA
jgi:hypothetical protein